jgi:hypothetical protein
MLFYSVIVKKKNSQQKEKLFSKVMFGPDALSKEFHTFEKVSATKSCTRPQFLAYQNYTMW